MVVAGKQKACPVWGRRVPAHSKALANLVQFQAAVQPCSVSIQKYRIRTVEDKHVMGKGKEKKAAAIPHQHVHARLAFLHQAIQHLHESQQRVEDERHIPSAGAHSSANSQGGQTRHLVNNLRGVSRRSVLRLNRETKHSFCKHCDVLLVPGQTAEVRVENASKGQRKSWADVKVVKCRNCGCVKRFPIGIDKDRKTLKPTAASGQDDRTKS